MPASSARGSYDAAALDRHLARRDADVTDATWKGVPTSYRGPVNAIGRAGLSLRKGNLPLPVAVLKQSAMAVNRQWMSRFLSLSGAVIAPHGKTTMAPRLFQMQLEDGAWGMTAATAQQVAVFVEFGIERVILANQLVGAENIRLVLDILASRPRFDFYCLVDSPENARQLATAVADRGLDRPLQVLVEMGAAGGRTGVRTVGAALELARLIKSLGPALALRGIEAYEGVFGALAPPEKEQRVRAMLEDVRELATLCRDADLFEAGTVILTAGGTEFYDLAGFELSGGVPRRDHLVVIRSGCYLTHDDLAYKRAFQALLRRSPSLKAITPPMTAALEVWAAVQSRPEPGLALATLGKRDISFDFEMPVPLAWLRQGSQAAPEPLPDGHRVLRLNDQHAYLATPHDTPLQVGDQIGFGVAHVCTTFDKWKTLLLVDDAYDVTGAVRTFF